MASVQVTLTGATPVTVPLGATAGRVVLTMISSPAEVYVTTDGSEPTAPTDVENPTTASVLAGAIGQQTVVQPALTAGHMVPTVINLASAGTPVVQLEW